MAVALMWASGCAPALMGLTGCAPAPAAPDLPPGEAGILRWRHARGEVAALRERFEPDEPYSMNVTLELTQPQLGKRMRARGTVAVRPPDALRMILLGPGGTTALDLWICRDRFRFSVPAVDLERRGDDTTPPEETRGLPVAFLRWWFLRPFGGRLLSFVDGATPRYVLRDGQQIIHLSPGEAAVRARRVSAHDAESLRIRGGRCGRVRYRQRSTGLDIDVSCERINDRRPPERAFADPDDPDQGCGGST